MSLREQIRQAVQTGIAAMDDLAEQATYTSVATPSYDPATGAITKPSTAYAAVPMVFTSYSRKEIDGEVIRPEDQKAVIAQLSLTPVPTLNDTITRADDRSSRRSVGVTGEAAMKAIARNNECRDGRFDQCNARQVVR
jgi:hypothetical protein